MTLARIIGPQECDQRRFTGLTEPPRRRLPFALGIVIGAALGVLAALIVAVW